MSDKRSDQVAIDDFDKRKWKRCADARPGDTVTVQGVKPCGKLGRVEICQVLNACINAKGNGDQVLVATTVYGRRWFGGSDSPYRLVAIVARGA